MTKQKYEKRQHINTYRLHTKISSQMLYHHITRLNVHSLQLLAFMGVNKKICNMKQDLLQPAS